MNVFLVIALLFLSTMTFARKEYSAAEAHLRTLVARKQIDLKNLTETFEYNNEKYKVSEFDKVIADNLPKIFLSIKDIDEAKQYAQNYLTAKSYILKSDTKSEQKKIVLSNSEEMFAYIYADKGSDILKEKIIECRQDSPAKTIIEPIEAILSKVEETTKTHECSELKRGEHKVLRRTGSNRTGNYLLKRQNDGSYQALVNINFTKVAGGSSPQSMANITKNCLNLASQAMSGPQGEKISIQMLTPDEVSQLSDDERPAQNEVKIQGPKFRSNSANFSDAASCGTLTHEVLHLLGLCDEYKEIEDGTLAQQYNCRVETKASSIMRDIRVFDDAVPQKLTCECGQSCKGIMNSSSDNLKKLYMSPNAVDIVPQSFRNKYCKKPVDVLVNLEDLNNPGKPVHLKKSTATSFILDNVEFSRTDVQPFYRIVKNEYDCSCPANDEDCLSEKRTILQKLKIDKIKHICPTLTVPKDRKNAPLGSNNKYAVDGDNLIIHAKGYLKNLLQPAHFNKILSGPCPGISNNYNKCAEFAMKGSADESSCNVPPECHKDSFYLGTAQ